MAAPGVLQDICLAGACRSFKQGALNWKAKNKHVFQIDSAPNINSEFYYYFLEFTDSNRIDCDSRDS
jgi:hypothetical protein